MTGQDFGWALSNLRAGLKLARSAWPGNQPYIVLMAGYPSGIPLNATTAQATGLPQGSLQVFNPYLLMYTAKSYFVPWALTNDDVLSTDWFVVK